MKKKKIYKSFKKKRKDNKISKKKVKKYFLKKRKSIKTKKKTKKTNKRKDKNNKKRVKINQRKDKNNKKRVKINQRKDKNIKKKRVKINKSSKLAILKIIRYVEIFKLKINFNFNLDQCLQNFFQGISDKISNKIEGVNEIIAEEKERRKKEKIKNMQQEKIAATKKSKLERQEELNVKNLEYKEEIRFEKERKKELQKFIRLEQAEVRKEQAEKQRKFLEKIKLEKKIEQFRKREALEIKNLEKYVLSQERESYEGVQERIDKIKQKYQALRDQKIRERVEQLGVKIEDGDNRSELLEKERQYNLERQKIEFALESFYRSAHSLCFQINKRYIPKYLSILRVIDRRFETGEIFIKWDEATDEEWLILIYIKNNSPDEGIIIEDKTDADKNVSYEFKTNEIFNASDLMVDALTKLLDRERKKKKNN